jgi:coenzyme F420-reducing hydrogenase delta subunit
MFMKSRAVRTYVFYCANNLAAGPISRLDKTTEREVVRTVSLPCSGKIDIPYLMKAFETGADGAVIVTCKRNDCHHFEGNLRAHKRAEGIDSLLEEIGFGVGRMAVIECQTADGAQTITAIEQFMERIRNLPLPGPPPPAVQTQESTVA